MKTEICHSRFTQKTSTCELCPSPLRTVTNINSNARWDRNSVYPYLYNIHKLIDKHKNPTGRPVNFVTPVKFVTCRKNPQRQAIITFK